MNCHEAMELMQKDLDEELTAAEHAALLAHLRDCPDCTDMHEKFKQLSGALESLPKVTPPFSIVDAILPKLDELGLLFEQGAAAEPPVPAPEEEAEPDGWRGQDSPSRPAARSGRSGKRGWFSWRIAGGVAAAALVLGMFIFNGQNRSLVKNADGMLFAGSEKKESASQPAAAGSDGVKIDKTDAAKKKQDGDGAAGDFGSSADNPANPPAAARSGATATPVPVPQAGKDERPVSASEAGPGHVMPPAKASGDAQPNESAAAAPPGSTAGGAAATIQPLPAPDAAASAPEPAASGATAVPAASPEASAGQGTDASKTIRGSQPAEEPAPTSAASGSAGGSESDAETNRGFAMTLKAPPESRSATFTFADGAYTALVRNRKVVIVDKDGQEVFASGIERKADDAIVFVAWDGTKLTYAVTSADGKTVSYSIDVKAKTETKN